jgi:predicted dehydrogenase
MIGFGIVGTGGMARAMAITIAHSRSARLIRIASASQDRAAAFAEAHRCAGGDLAALLDDDRIEAVYIASANRHHQDQAIAALRSGRPTLIEKPAALTAEGYDAIMAAADGRLWMEAIATPFLPAIAEAIARSRSDPPDRLEASFGYVASPEVTPSLFASDSGVLLDRMIYPLALARMIMGPVVDADFAVDCKNERIDTEAQMTLRHAHGQSQIAASLLRRLPNRMALRGRGAPIVVPAPLLTARRIGTRSLPAEQNPILRRAYEGAARITGGWRPFGATDRKSVV